MALLDSRYRRFQSLCVGHTHCHARSHPQSKSLDVGLLSLATFLAILSPFLHPILSVDGLTRYFASFFLWLKVHLQVSLLVKSS